MVIVHRAPKLLVMIPLRRYSLVSPVAFFQRTHETLALIFQCAESSGDAAAKGSEIDFLPREESLEFRRWW